MFFEIMKFIIIWETYPEKLSEILNSLKSKDKIWEPPSGLRSLSECVTPDGKFIQLVSVDNEYALSNYIYRIGITSNFCKKIDTYPVLSLDEWINNASFE